MITLPKKILFITHSSSLGGGGEYDFLRLLVHFSGFKDKYIVHGMFPKGTKDYLLASNCAKWGYYRWGFLPSHYSYGLINYFRYLHKLYFQIRDVKNFTKYESYDLCIINVVVILWPVLYLFYKKFKVIIFIRENIYPIFLRKLIYKIIAKNSSFIITNSKTKKEDFVNITGSQKVEYVYPGIEDIREIGNTNSLLTLNKKLRYKIIKKDRFKLVNIGDINKLKNQILIVQSLILLKKEIKNIPYMFFVGHYDMSDKYFQNLFDILKKNNLQDTCFFLGHLLRSDVYKIIDNCNATIISSKSEGMPISMIESLKYGKPVISTKVGGVHEIIINMVNGILIEHDEIDLKNAIKELMNNEDLYKKMSKSAQNTYSDFFDVKLSLNKIEHIFNNVLNQKDTQN